MRLNIEMADIWLKLKLISTFFFFKARYQNITRRDEMKVYKQHKCQFMKDDWRQWGVNRDWYPQKEITKISAEYKTTKSVNCVERKQNVKTIQ